MSEASVKEELSVKEKLLKSLFEAPKTTGTLALELGYSRVSESNPGKVNAKYENVRRQLKELNFDGYLGSELDTSKPRHGPPPTRYWMIYDIPVLVKMMEEFPVLISEMQMKDNVVNTLVDKHKYLMNPLPQCPLVIKEELQIQFKTRLQVSESFFKLCMKNETQSLMEMFEILSAKRMSVNPYEKSIGEKIREKFILERDKYPFDLIFDACIDMDILTGLHTEKGIRYSIERNRVAMLFCDWNVGVLEKKFVKNRHKLGINVERLEDCSVTELQQLLFS
jgi:hypothetical protein